MKKKTKIKILVAITFLIIYLIIWMILKSRFTNLDNAFVLIFSAILSLLVSPRIKRLKNQTGNSFQIIWFFMKKTVF